MIPQYIKVAISLDDGQIAIMSFITQGRGDVLAYGAHWIAEGVWWREPTDENIFCEVMRSFPGLSDEGEKLPKPIGYKIVGESDIPKDRTYRNAWKHDGRTIVHDMDKAREIHRNHLREARDPAIKILDIVYMKADEVGDEESKKMIAEAKQKLRDMTKHPDIEAAQTIEELKSVWPL